MPPYSDGCIREEAFNFLHCYAINVWMYMGTSLNIMFFVCSQLWIQKVKIFMNSHVGGRSAEIFEVGQVLSPLWEGGYRHADLPNTNWCGPQSYSYRPSWLETCLMFLCYMFSSELYIGMLKIVNWNQLKLNWRQTKECLAFWEWDTVHLWLKVLNLLYSSELHPYQ